MSTSSGDPGKIAYLPTRYAPPDKTSMRISFSGYGPVGIERVSVLHEGVVYKFSSIKLWNIRFSIGLSEESEHNYIHW
jgi:hypothetical protein